MKDASADVTVVEEITELVETAEEVPPVAADHDYSKKQNEPLAGPSGLHSGGEGNVKQSNLDRFAVRQTPTNPNHLANVSAADRAKYKSTKLTKAVHESGGKLFCSVCNVVIDHKRHETRPTNSGLQPDTSKPEYYYY